MNKNISINDERSTTEIETDTNEVLKQELTEIYYSKTEVLTMLNPIFNYLELLSRTYEIQLENGLIISFKKPII